MIGVDDTPLSSWREQLTTTSSSRPCLPRDTELVVASDAYRALQVLQNAYRKV